MNTFYLIRHAQTEDNSSDIVSSANDTILTSRGYEQIENCIENLQKLNVKFPNVIHSPKFRCFETGRIISERFHLQIIEESLIKERNFGK